MRPTVRAAVLAASGVLVLTLMAAAFAARLLGGTPDSPGGRLLVRVAHSASEPVVLYRAGSTLDGAVELASADAGMWVAPANYFARATRGSFPLLYPVPLEGFRSGPDRGGAFAVTVRPGAVETPPLAGGASGWAYVPAGYSVIGDRKNPDEPHFVWSKAFFVGVLEVTNGEFRRFVRDPGGYDDRRNWTAAGWLWRSEFPSQATARLTPSEPDYGRFGEDTIPVVLVTWYEADAYARWLTRELGGGLWEFRLPTEAEWEKAARGPDSFDYGLGMTLSEPEAPLYNWKKNPGAAVTLVGLAAGRGIFRANRFGIYHMSGNASEWTRSAFWPYNRQRPYRDDGRNDDDATGMRVTRGGSWYSASVVRLHLAYREEFQPNMSSNDLGFRLAAYRLPVAGPGGSAIRPPTR